MGASETRRRHAHQQICLNLFKNDKNHQWRQNIVYYQRSEKWWRIQHLVASHVQGRMGPPSHFKREDSRTLWVLEWLTIVPFTFCVFVSTTAVYNRKFYPDKLDLSVCVSLVLVEWLLQSGFLFPLKKPYWYEWPIQGRCLWFSALSKHHEMPGTFL